MLIEYIRRRRNRAFWRECDLRMFEFLAKHDWYPPNFNDGEQYFYELHEKYKCY